MGKRLFQYIFLGLLVGSVSYGIHQLVVSASEVMHPFELVSIYIFFGIFSISICVAFELLATRSSQYSDQLGFIYMGTMALKIILFCVVFRAMLFYGPAFAKADALSLLIPIFVFLIYEVYIIAKILNRNS